MSPRKPSVATSSSSTTSAAAATQLSNCQDPSCGVTLEQPLTGRPRLYCDATCRKNAARHRAWAEYLAARESWQSRDAIRRRQRLGEQRVWDARPVPKAGAWELTARKHGWQPPYGWDLAKKVAAYGERPADYRTPASDCAPAQPSSPRTGAKGSW